MNERIRELINEATSFKEGLIEGKYDIEVFDKEKFVELIVRECIDCIDGSPTTEENTLILSKYFIIGNLKKHFGVEE